MGFCRRTAAALFIFFIAPATSHAQAVQRSLYVSVLNDAGAPVPDLGPSDFIVREDGLAREVLRVAPATDPMQIAVLVDNSQAARDDIADMRKALHAFVTAMTAGIGLGKLAKVIHPYPTQSEAIKRLADAYSRTRLSPRLKSLLSWWLR